jgi:hypothetical protein
MRRVSLLVLCLLIPHCGGIEHPTTPGASSNLPLQPGPQVLTVVGFGVSYNPLYPPCAPRGVPYDGTSVDTLVTLQRDGGYWVARSTAPELGTVELRFRESAAGLRVAGTIRGIGVDAGVTPTGIVHDVLVSFAGDDGDVASVEGALASPVSAMVNGRIAGRVRFSDSDGNASTCSAITWSLQPDRRP